MSAHIQASVPILASLDLDQSAAFYTSGLGFQVLLRVADYLIIERDGCELHFWACAERHIAENTSCYLRTADCQALYEEFAQRGIALQPPVLQSWGMKELYVIDPHGNLLKFGEQPAVRHSTLAEEIS
ncbi:VOC family protein [Stutzerimonas stutzeri]|uniref:bleomycin resistance protein n=1 Tax=Stutzerimonas stutzeri TaxID=316 RepID=UPI00066A4567|nr:VOC family protein [Stutzerimonas stutzeri]NMY65671.1 VOC family protein [Pseudomonas sp. WS 5018]HCL16754.1 VOC family protein [Pseudomonas sp.]MDH0442563.1 VOC family protein [Stutzerimonas stutzeri]MDI9737775.1 VOC family protein [Stutzerimonas stutzeri]OCX59539.1 glyoxalase [Stutzerimonas stutzeri]